MARLTDAHAALGLLGAALLLTGTVGSVVVPMSQGTVVLALTVVAFAVTLLALQWRAPHRRNLALVGLWRLGALGLLAATFIALVGICWPHCRNALLAGVLGIGIALPALVLGMLLEIVYFPAWLGLQRQRQRGERVPPVDTLFCESRKSRLLTLHAFAMLGLMAAAVWPSAITTRASMLGAGAQDIADAL